MADGNRWEDGSLTFKTSSPCPLCHERMVLGFYYLSQEGKHQHTHYVCLSWPHPGSRCGWHGWTIPGWDEMRDSVSASTSEAAGLIGALAAALQEPHGPTHVVADQAVMDMSIIKAAQELGWDTTVLNEDHEVTMSEWECHLHQVPEEIEHGETGVWVLWTRGPLEDVLDTALRFSHGEMGPTFDQVKVTRMRTVT